MSKIMAINSGSSSLKFQLMSMSEESVIIKGLFERIGMPSSILTTTRYTNGVCYKEEREMEIPDHSTAVQLILKQLTESKIVESLTEISGVGHRVVHGGERFNDAVIVDEQVLRQIEECNDLAPLHNPSNVMGIKAFKEALPGVPIIAVFDTAFHQTMPEKAFLYSLPYEYYVKYGIRKYGFHGISHKYVTQRAAELLDKPIKELRLISCHLGNGASIAAVEGGRSIDTSMGFTPLAGVAMGTRSGNIDPALIPFIMDKTGKTADEVVFDVLNKKSGMLGISGISSDLRDLEAAAEQGSNRAELALEVFAGRIHKYIGSYAARMYGVDAIIFTAGIGENSSIIREKVLKGLEFMGIYWDTTLNKVRGKEATLTYPHSPVKVYVIPTNEEVMIARDTARLCNIQ
jgi:acetate kinase